MAPFKLTSNHAPWSVDLLELVVPSPDASSVRQNGMQGFTEDDRTFGPSIWTRPEPDGCSATPTTLRPLCGPPRIGPRDGRPSVSGAQ
jgi:hypothetical protein